MAEITRPGNVQAFAFLATPGERTVFGDTVQSDALADNLNSDFFAGWENGVDASGFPPRQFFNAVGYTATQLIAYMFQRGIPQWDVAQEYYHPAFVTGSDNKLYASVQDNTGQDPTTDGGTNWIDYADSISTTVPDASETERGIVELATQAETNAGTDDLRAITPLKLANWSGGFDGTISQIGSGRTTTGTWTISSLTPNKPVHIIIANISPSSGASLRYDGVTGTVNGSGSSGVGSGREFKVASDSNFANAAPPSFTLVPSGTSIDINLVGMSNVIAYSFQ